MATEDKKFSTGNTLVPPSFDNLFKSATHTKARTEIGKGYPQRVFVPDTMTWGNIDMNTYHPIDYTSEIVLANKLWADPQDPRMAEGAPNFPSHERKILVDERGRPLNPHGPTGLEGRGLLGKWGPNFAADPIVTRINDDGKLEMIVVKRKDTGEWAIPGGMVDRGERLTATLQRELGEETSINLDFKQADPVYQGYVDDPRNTDNSWMETDAYHLHLPSGIKIELNAGDDAAAVRWMELTEENVKTLYANHSNFVLRAVDLWQKKIGQVVEKNGFIKTKPE
jgi:ADP-ribose pyrophosphatase